MTEKKKSRFVTPWTYKFDLKKVSEKNTGDSLTVPGEAYTVEQLLQRARTGVPLNTIVDIKPGHFAQDADFDTFTPPPDFDLVDAQEIYETSKEVIDDANQKIAEHKKKASPKPSKEEPETIQEGTGAAPNLGSKAEKSAKNDPHPDE